MQVQLQVLCYCFLAMFWAWVVFLQMCSRLDPRQPWGTLIEFQISTSHYIHQVWHILLSPNPHSFVDFAMGL
jgi:hypothetical protein